MPSNKKRRDLLLEAKANDSYFRDVKWTLEKGREFNLPDQD